MVIAPRWARLAWDRFDAPNRLPFHIQIHFRVTNRRGWAGMPQIVADRRQIGPRLQKGYGCAVTHAVRMEPFLAKIGDIFGSTVETPGEDVADPEPGQWFATVIQENESF